VPAKLVAMKPSKQRVIAIRLFIAVRAAKEFTTVNTSFVVVAPTLKAVATERVLNKFFISEK
jgi:hypothetical protein